MLRREDAVSAPTTATTTGNTVLRFGAEVNDALLAKLLVAAGYEQAEVKALSPAARRGQAVRVFGATAPLSHFAPAP